jgi:PAS domain S-box-containing protein
MRKAKGLSAEEAARLQLLLEASTALLGSLSVEPMLPKVLELAQRTLAADAYALWRVDESGTWDVAAHSGLSETYVERATEAVRGNEAVVSLDEPLVVEDIAAAEWLTPDHRKAHAAEGNRSMLAVGLRHRDETLGTVAFYFREPHHFPETELSAASLLANLAAAALGTARLYERERRLADDRKLLDAVFEAAPVGLALMDTSLRYVRVNEELARINARSAEEHVGRSLRDVLGDALADEVEPLHRQVLETGEPIRDLNVTRASPQLGGAPRTQLVSYYPVRNAAGAKIGVGVVLADVSEREHARAAAEAAGERLRVLAEASQQLASTLDYETTLSNLATLLVPRYADWYAVDVIDDDGRFRRLAVVHRDPAKAEWAAKSQEVYPVDADEAEGPARVVRTGKPALYRTISDELLVSSTKDEGHYEVLRALGMESAMVVPLTAGGRTFGALMLVSADPSRLFDEDDLDFAQHLGRRAAVAVDNARLYGAAEERARAALVVEHVADGVALVDRDGVIRLWNPGAAHITGLSAAESVGRRADELFGSWDPAAGLSTAGTGHPVTQAVEVDGRELWLSITGVEFEQGRVYAFRDLTAERGLEALKSDFVSTVSHELRTPLAAIYGAALTLRRRDVQLREPQRDGLLEVIANESDRLARIVNDILWASRLESGVVQTAIEQCDGIDLARSVVDAARQYIPPSIDLVLETPDDAPAIAADTDKVRQVLTNLVDNAVKYSPDGGRVTMSVAVDGPRLRYSVRDEGLGVPPAEHRRIFEKFYRLDPDLTRGVGGTGLGLYISRELLERMGGRIWVESSGTGGSVFVAELPLAHQVGPAPETGREPDSFVA